MSKSSDTSKSSHLSKAAYKSNPVATIGGIVTLVIIGLAAKHCMKKYG